MVGRMEWAWLTRELGWWGGILGPRDGGLGCRAQTGHQPASGRFWRWSRPRWDVGELGPPPAQPPPNPVLRAGPARRPATG